MTRWGAAAHLAVTEAIHQPEEATGQQVGVHWANLAAILALGLVGAAHRVHRDPARATGALAIAAAGYATAYLDVMAVTRIYEWLPPAAGLALAGVIAASGIVLARAWDSQFLALLTVGGVAALAPALSGASEVLTAGFLVVLALASYPAHLGRSWLALHAARVAPAALAILALSTAGRDANVTLGLAAILAGFDLGTVLLAGRARTATRLSLIHISEPTDRTRSRMPSSA